MREDVDAPKASLGTVASLQTFGSYGANFHPHVHAIVTEGVFHGSVTDDATFEMVLWWDLQAVAELFRRRVLRRLRDAHRLRPETEEMLLGWQHSGFSVHASEPILPDDTARQEHLARYVTRAPLRIDAVTPKPDGKVLVQTPYVPRTGKRGLLLDELELIRRLCAQIPAPRQHMVRYLGWYSSRARGERAKREATVTAVPVTRDDSPQAKARRRSWARLIRRIFEVDPLLCPKCKVEMKPVAVIQDIPVVDKILAHLRRIGGNDPHEGTGKRGPPAE